MLSKSVFFPSTTKTKPSPIHECVLSPPLRAPAILSPTAANLAMLRLNVNKGVMISQTALNFMMDCYTHTYKLDTKANRRLLTMDEAINGNPDLGLVNCNMQSSAGFGFNKGTGKRAYFIQRPSGQYDPTPELVERVDYMISEAKAGRRTPVIFQVNLKDELRLVEKVKAMKTRPIQNCPLDFYVVMRIYVGSYLAWLHTKHLTHPFSCGVNPTSLSWAIFHQRVMTKRYRSFGDFRHFDYSFLIQIMYLFVDAINAWYSDEHQATRRVLFENIIHHLGVMGAFVWITTGVNPSGQPTTTEMNSFHTFCTIVWVVHVLLARAGKPCEPEDVMRTVDMIIYGDDNAIGSDEPELQFDAISLAMHQEFGLEYVAVDGETFLKRSWVWRTERHANLCFAPLPRELVLDMTNWVDAGENEHATFESTLTSALDEAVQHGREFYDTFLAKLITACRDRLVNLEYVTYDVKIDRLIRTSYTRF
jgi:hypothetical protein